MGRIPATSSPPATLLPLHPPSSAPQPTRRSPMELVVVIVLALLGLAAEFERHRARRN